MSYYGSFVLPGLKRSPIENRVFTGSDGLYLSFVPSQYLNPDFACWYHAENRVKGMPVMVPRAENLCPKSPNLHEERSIREADFDLFLDSGRISGSVTLSCF